MNAEPAPRVVRITFDVGPEVHASLCLIPHGFRRYAYRWLMEGFALYLREHPEQALRELVSRHINYSSLLSVGASYGRSLERADEPAESTATSST